MLMASVMPIVAMMRREVPRMVGMPSIGLGLQLDRAVEMPLSLWKILNKMNSYLDGTVPRAK